MNILRNAELFKKYLDNNELTADIWEDGDDTYFQFHQKLDSGAQGRILVILGGDSLLSVYALDYVNLTNSERKDQLYKILNDLNGKYTYYKFYLDEKNKIYSSSFVPFENNFTPDVVMRLIVGTLNVLDEVYPLLMKIIWA